MNHHHRTPLIKFLGRRSEAVWQAHAGHAPAPHFAQAALTAHVPATDNFFNAPPFPPLPRSAAPQTVRAPVFAAPGAAAAPGLAPQTIVRQPVAAKGAAAPSSVLLYPSAELIPGSFRAKALSQKEIDMVDLGGIYDPPKPVKKDAPKKNTSPPSLKPFE
ncbi:hypothetical protein BDR26DRAFT_874624 [Obelidium mucronatum]|nr:hypothetical protein BDR26DRAFT_874624 [Obelidium mucronatum]